MLPSSTVLDPSDLIEEVEPIFVSHYKDQTGVSPTLYELKQYLVTQATDNLIEVLQKSESSIINSMSTNELLATINLYIRKLRIW